MKKKTILIVDDSVVRDLLKDTLEGGYHVLEASSYQDVIEQLENPIDLAVIESILPDAYGSEVLNVIREVKPGIPIIVMGHGKKPTLKALRNMDYIQKPFQMVHLRKRVSEMLNVSKQSKR